VRTLSYGPVISNEGNVNPQLILADLLRGLRLDLVGAG
jgi:hypothetical protein